MTKIWPVFSNIIECDKPQNTIGKGPKDNPTITVEDIRSILWHLRGCLKTQNFEKNGNFSSEKKILASFSPIIELSSMTNLKQHFLRIHEVIWVSLRK